MDGFADLSPKQQREWVKATHSKVYDYRRWDDVLRALELKNAKSLITNEEIASTATKTLISSTLMLPPNPFGPFSHAP